MSYYAADGSINVTVVSGSALTGLYAADGSINVIESSGSTLAGAYHPCGAWYVTLSPGTLVSIRAADGSLYVQKSPYTNNSGQRVTVVSGALGVPLDPVGSPIGLLLTLTKVA